VDIIISAAATSRICLVAFIVFSSSLSLLSLANLARLGKPGYLHAEFGLHLVNQFKQLMSITICNLKSSGKWILQQLQEKVNLLLLLKSYPRVVWLQNI